MVLKRELARRSWAIDAFVGAVFKHRGSGSLGMSCGFNSAANRLEFRFEKSFKIGHDLCAIDHDRPRSSVDHVPDAPEMTIEGRGVDPTRKDPRSPTPSDWNPTLQIPAKREKNQSSS